MDRGAWQATVHAVTRVGHNLVIKPSPDTHLKRKMTKLLFTGPAAVTSPKSLKGRKIKVPPEGKCGERTHSGGH